jgi:MoaA/NifB/PqqE/SkfB family radical SAM enzyme
MCDLNFKNNSFAASRLKAKGNMPIDLFKRLIDSVKTFEPEILLIGVEPLRHPNLMEAIRYVSSNNLYSQINTDGLLLSEYAQELVKSNLSHLVVSIDGDQATHDSIRGKAGAFAKTLEGIEKVLQFKKQYNKSLPKVSIHTVISDQNCTSIEKIVSIFADKDIDCISFDQLSFLTEKQAKEHNNQLPDMSVTPSSVFDTHPEKVDVDALNKCISDIRSKQYRMPIVFFPNLIPEELNKYYFKPLERVSGFTNCLYPWKYAQVLPDGEVTVNFRCFGGSMGNINREDFKSIWKASKYRDFRRLLKEKKMLPACNRCFGLFSSHYL